MSQKQKKYKVTTQDKIDAARALAEKHEKAERRKKKVMTVFIVVLCVLLIFAFCFPALTMLI